MLVECLLVLALLFAEGSCLQVICSDDGEVNFDFILVETTVVPRYRLKRIFRDGDKNCAGSLDIIGITSGNVQYTLMELGSEVFQNLPLVETINLPNHAFKESMREMYNGSPRIHTINLNDCFFSKLDLNIQFPTGLKKLDFSNQAYFAEMTLDSIGSYQGLTELDISGPDLVPEFTFGEGIFQNSNSLEKLKMSSMPVQNLKKSLLSNHVSTLKHVDMTRWSKLTHVDNNAFSGVVLDELNLSEWPLQLSADLFSGASIKRLMLSRSKIQALRPGSFAGLLDSQKIDLSGSQLTLIESGSFDNFTPTDNFELVIPKEISCCNMDGVRELINVSKGISINRNTENYTCVTPDNVDKVVDILSNEDPTVDLRCCDYRKEYYNSQSQLCEECHLQEFCAESSINCEGEETNFLTCDKCMDGYTLQSFVCTECVVSPDCIEASMECSPAVPGNEPYLKCNTCAAGLAPNPVSGLCEACLELSPSCIQYDNYCVSDTQSLACMSCNDDTELREGNCVTIVGGLSLPSSIIIGVVVGAIFLMGLGSVIALVFCLRCRKKKKKKKLHKICGISKNETNIELHPVEFESSKSDAQSTGGYKGYDETGKANLDNDCQIYMVPSNTHADLDRQTTTNNSGLDYIDINFQMTKETDIGISYAHVEFSDANETSSNYLDLDSQMNNTTIYLECDSDTTKGLANTNVNRVKTTKDDPDSAQFETSKNSGEKMKDEKDAKIIEIERNDNDYLELFS